MRFQEKPGSFDISEEGIVRDESIHDIRPGETGWIAEFMIRAQEGPKTLGEFGENENVARYGGIALTFPTKSDRDFVLRFIAQARQAKALSHFNYFGEDSLAHRVLVLAARPVDPKDGAPEASLLLFVQFSWESTRDLE